MGKEGIGGERDVREEAANVHAKKLCYFYEQRCAITANTFTITTISTSTLSPLHYITLGSTHQNRLHGQQTRQDQQQRRPPIYINTTYSSSEFDCAQNFDACY